MNDKSAIPRKSQRSLVTLEKKCGRGKKSTERADLPVDIPRGQLYYLASKVTHSIRGGLFLMFFSVDPSSGVAIYLQIVRQIKFAIAEESLRPGHLLPSVRQLSQQLAVNPNTVARAIGQLQADGVVETLRGRGTVVSKGAVAQCRKERKSIVADRIGDVLAEALHAGVSADELRQVVEQKLMSLNGKVQSVSTPEDQVRT